MCLPQRSLGYLRLLQNRDAPPGRGAKSLFNSSQKAPIKEWAKQEPRQLKNVSQKVQETWGISPSIKTIQRIVKMLNMSWHRMRKGVAAKPPAHE